MAQANTQSMTEALLAIDAAFAVSLNVKDTRTTEEVDADFRAFNLAAARRIMDRAARARRWMAAVDARNPVGPSMARFYGETRAQRARRLAEVARLRRLAVAS